MDTVMTSIYNAIQSEYEAIHLYKKASELAGALCNTKAQALFNEIATDEMTHVGNLLKAMKELFPEEAQLIGEHLEKGATEAEKVMQEAPALEEDDNFQFFIETLEPYSSSTTVNKENKTIELSCKSLENPHHTWNTLNLLSHKHPATVSYDGNVIVIKVD